MFDEIDDRDFYFPMIDKDRGPRSRTCHGVIPVLSQDRTYTTGPTRPRMGPVICSLTTISLNERGVDLCVRRGRYPG